MEAIDAALAFGRRHTMAFVEDLQAFVRYPSVSAQPRHSDDVARCAAWLAGHMRSIGLQSVRVVRTVGHPVVIGSWMGAPGKPILLVYGHYDVQPARSSAEWRDPPFAAVIKDGYLYGRGSSDDKGQVLAHLKAVECYLKTAGALPLNVVCVVEGEEETGSRHLPAVLSDSGIRADAAVVSDMPMASADRPAITVGMRGALSFEVEVRGPRRDLHSGLFGGAVLNPAHVLCRLIADLEDIRGEVTVPGFYAGVFERSPGERTRFRKDGPSDAQIAVAAGVDALWGDPQFSGYERITIRPALIVNGLTAGYQEAGAKAIIPSHATAKVSARLAFDQDPAAVAAAIGRYLQTRCPPEVRLRLRWQSAARAAETAVSHPLIHFAAEACRASFGQCPALIRSGGTIPIVDVLQRQMGISVLMLGFAHPDDGAHAPNERFSLSTFHRAITTSVHFLALMGGTRITEGCL